MSPWRPVQAACGALTLALSACQSVPPTEPDYGRWQQQHAAAVQALARFLAEEGLGSVLPLPQLLKSASDWRGCSAEPYAVPPPAQWSSVAAVLRLVQELQRQQLIGEIEVFSGYRNPALNACADGAPASAHTRSFALDFKPVDGLDRTTALCAFWQRQGRAWNMGFSRYPSGRIHVDTAGYRTWGADHTGRSTACAAG